MTTKIVKLILVSLIIMFVLSYFIEMRKYTMIRKNLKYVNASIIFVGKGVKESEYTVRYKFDNNGTEYIEQNGYGIYEIDKKCLEGKFFKVGYDSPNPSNSQILITKEDYSRFNIPQPDSFPCVYKCR